MLKLSLRPSRLLATLLALAHGAAIAIILLVSIPQWLQALAVTCLAVQLFIVLRRHALLRAPDSLVAIEIHSDNTISVQMRRGEWSNCTVLGDSYVTAYLVVLNLRQADSRAVKRVVILPDGIDAEELRRLRVWLRWREATQSA